MQNMMSQMAQDPSFQQMAQSLQQSLQGEGSQNPDPSKYMQAMQEMMQNSEFMQMAEKIGNQMMQDPQMSQMISQMQSPEYQSRMMEKLENLRQDPEVGQVIKELEEEGPAALAKYWNDSNVLSKFGEAMGTDNPLHAMGLGSEHFGSEGAFHPSECNPSF